MTMWNDRLLPHPLLAYWNDDYGDAVFRLTLSQDPVLNDFQQVTILRKYHLTSPYLKQLISTGIAEYVLLITCPGTFARTVIKSGREEEDVEILDATNYTGQVSLSPYIVASQRIENFISAEHAEEIRRAMPEGFTVEEGTILAVGRAQDFYLGTPLDPASSLDLVADAQVKQGVFDVQLDDNRIKIHVCPEDKEKLDRLRQDGEGSTSMAMLFPALYLHAVAEGLRRLEDYADRTWVASFRDALDKLDPQEQPGDDGDIKERSLHYAQILLQGPLGKMLGAMTNPEED